MKGFTSGTLIRFIHAPPRWEGDTPRNPGPGVDIGDLAVIIDYAGDDAHQWGGIFNVAMVHTGDQFMHWGDFMEEA
jgi:hypothetical protein